jgi:hypothetical protein
MKRHAPALILVAAALLAVSGCAEKKVSVSGKVTRAGQPLPAAQTLLVVLVPEGGGISARTYPAETDPATGTFSVAGLPPGRYRVAIQHFDDRFRDSLGGVYDLGASPLVYDITGAGQALDIDLPAVLPARAPVSGVTAGKGDPGPGREGKERKKDKDD